MRTLILLAVAAVLLALPFSGELLAGKKPRVKVCHITDTLTRTVRCPLPDGTIGVQIIQIDVGHVIEINGNAWPAHQAHGDVLAPAGSNVGDECRGKARRSRCRPLS